MNKTEIINLRVTEDEKKLIQKNAKNFEMNVSNYILQLAKNPQIVILQDGKKLAEELFKFNQNVEKYEKILSSKNFKLCVQINKEIVQLYNNLEKGGDRNVNT